MHVKQWQSSCISILVNYANNPSIHKMCIYCVVQFYRVPSPPRTMVGASLQLTFPTPRTSLMKFGATHGTSLHNGATGQGTSLNNFAPTPGTSPLYLITPTGCPGGGMVNEKIEWHIMCKKQSLKWSHPRFPWLKKGNQYLFFHRQKESDVME